MASYKIYPDKRRLRKDGTAPVKIQLNHRGGQRYVSTSIYMRPEDWDAQGGKALPSCPLHRQLNIRLAQIRLAADQVMLGTGPLAPLAEVVETLKRALGLKGEEAQGQEQAAPLLLDAARRFAATKQEWSTRRSYDQTALHLERFRPAATLDEVNRTWLAEFDSHLSATAQSPNGRAVYMRNLRAVFNYAIDEGLTSNYPFRKYRIKTVPTAKRSLSAADIRRLWEMEPEDWQRHYRDFFMLSFLLIGANAKDILHLPAGADSSGRVEFNRAKTKKLYSIKVEPEARGIIDRYRGQKHMLSVMDEREDYQQYIRQCNHALKLLGTRSRKGLKPEGEPWFPGLTTYWARHSWATIAAELDIPKETIAAALGHDMGNMTTAIYINFNQAKVDEALRRVIDFALYGKR